jgi:hypothetical protein
MVANLVLVLALVGSVSAELVAHWKLDEIAGAIASDSSGNGHDGMLRGNPAWVPGQIGGGLEFDGVDDYVDCGTFNPSETTNKLSISLWAKWNGLNGVWQGLVAKRDDWSAGDMMWLLEAGIDTGGLVFLREGSYPDVGDPVLPVGEWAHVAVSFDGTIVRLYVNGGQTGSGLFSFGSDTVAHVMLGASQQDGANPFNGALDDVRIYSHALSVDDIQLLLQPEVPPADVNGFTYQGRLMDNNFAADGLYDFHFKLYDAVENGIQQGDTIILNELDVIDGYFTVALDFPSDTDIFNGNDRWLQIGVRPGNSTGSFTTLSPRQKITPAPYAIYAETAGSALSGPGGGGADSDWTISGSDIYHLTGNVGIGTSSPTTKLDVNGQMRIRGGSPGAGKILTSDAIGLASWQTPTGGGGPDGDWAVSGNNMYSMPSGNVGVGTSSPTTKLDVNGQLRVRGGSPGAGKVLTSDAAGLASWQEPTDGNDGDWTLSGNDIYSSASGNVGIGTTDPGSKLEVAGFTVEDVGLSIIKATNTGRGLAVYGKSKEGTAVFGEAERNTGVYGWSREHTGVNGTSLSGSGVKGISDTHWGVYGVSVLGTGGVGATGCMVKAPTPLASLVRVAAAEKLVSTESTTMATACMAQSTVAMLDTLAATSM